MRPLRLITIAIVLGLSLGLIIGIALAQTAPVPQLTCEQKLDQAQEQNLTLRKRVAQAEWQSAAVEEIALACQKKVGATEAAPKAQAAPAKPPAPDVGKK